MSRFSYSDMESMSKKIQMINNTKHCIEFPSNHKNKKDPELQQLVESLEAQGYEKDKDFFVSTNFVNFITNESYSAAIMMI